MIGYIRDKYIFIDKFYTAFHMHLKENHFSGNEVYSFWELIYVIDGEMTTTAGNNVYKLQKNSLILYEPSEFHTLSVDEGKFAEIFILSFSLEGTHINKLKLLPFTLSGTLLSGMENIIDFCNSADNVTSYSFFDSYHESFLSQPLFLSKLCNLTEYLLLALCDASPSKNSALDTQDTLLFSSITKTMVDQKENFLTITELSKIHSISPTKIKMLIKTYTGLSLHKYYTELKLSQATELFRQGYNISEVSAMLGFCNSNYFSSVFKREMNETPSCFIKKLKILI